MNGIHGLDGMHGMGPINPESDEPVFHADWERQTFAGGLFNDSESRYAIKSVVPAQYLTKSYYEHWLHSPERVLVEKGQLERAELEAAWSKAEEEAT